MASTNIDERFADFPAPIREAIAQSEWQAKLRQIASKYHLRIDQGTILEDETLAILDGSQSIEEYTVHLAGLLKLGEQDMRAMATDLERDIFAPIQKAIQQMLPRDEAGEVANASLGTGEEDDLEALLNEGDDAIAKVAAAVSLPKAPAPKPAPAPLVPTPAPKPSLAESIAKVSTPTPFTQAPSPVKGFSVAAPSEAAVSVPLSKAAEKLSAPVVKAAETVVGNLQKAASPAPAAPASTSSDPYREPVI